MTDLPAERSEPQIGRGTVIAVAMIVLLAGAVRAPGLFTDFWLDEIWSINIAHQLQSAWGVLTEDEARIDNNHPLNTLLLRWTGDPGNAWVYRIPALLSGVGAVIAAAIAMRRRSSAEMVAAALLVGFSFPMIFYASEARGYAMASCFALVAFDALLAYTRRPTWASAILFNLACVLGFLSHLTFVHFYFAAMLWSVLRSRRLSRSIPQQLLIWGRINLVPLAFCAFLYRVFVRDIRIGGSPDTSALEVLIKSLSMPLGGPSSGQLSGVVAITAGVLFLLSVIHLFRKRDDLGVFYVLAVIVAPGFLVGYDHLLNEKPQPLMLRYFLVAITFMLIAIAHLAAEAWRGGGPSVRIVVLLLAATFVGANVWRTVRFLDVGRGGYSRAITHMIQRSSDREITVASDNTFRSKVVVDFYAPRLLPPGRSIDFYPDQPDKPHPPEFVIEDGRTWWSPVKEAADGSVYRIEWLLPAHELSGFEWRLYRIDLEETLRRRTAKRHEDTKATK